MEEIKNSYLKLCEENHLIGSNFVVANTNSILDSVSYGYQNLENKDLSSSKTIYRIASISKTVGSIALMQLVEAGKISLDDDISKHLGFIVRNPKYPNDVITVRMITLQTSSILDGYDDENDAFDVLRRGYNGVNGRRIDVTLKDLLTNSSSIYYTTKTFGNYKPGTRWNYSNFGCGIMACIIEKVSGEFYIDYMENHIFKPLGLDASFKASHIVDKANIANMYTKRKSGLKTFPKEDFIDSSLKRYALGDNFRGPAGGLFISMESLSIIMRMFLNYGTYNGVRLLKRETVETMYQMQWCGLSNDSYRAKGIQMKILANHPNFPLRGHTGGAYGVSSYMFFSLKYQVGACFITNGIDDIQSEKYRQNIFDETLNLFLNKYAVLRPTTAIIKNNEILLEERKISDKEMMLGNFMKAMNFADMMNTVGIYNEDKLEFTLTINGVTETIKDVILYHDNLYINLFNTLDLFNITYTKQDDCYIVNYI